MLDNNSLTTKQRRAIAALLNSRTIEEAAKKAGTSESTVHRWLRQGPFKAALAQAEEEAIGQAVRLMAGATSEAVETLLAIIRNPKVTDKTRVAAIRVFMGSLPPLRLLGSIEKRLADLQKEGEDVFNFERGQEDD